MISFHLQAQFTREQAISVIVNEVVGINSLSDHYLFSKYEIMHQEDTLWLDGFYDYYLPPYDENWVFFVDDLPIAFWAHPCRIIFFDEISGTYEIFDDEWPPEPYLSNQDLFLLQWEWILSIGTELNKSDYNRLNVFPNPFRNTMNIIADDTRETMISITDITGNLIYKHKLQPRETLHIRFSDQSSRNEIYFVKAVCGEDIIWIKKLVRTSQ
jgi:hypothetical protein